MSRQKQLKSAEIDWSETQPRSCQFGDIYFSQEDGVAETEYVFLKANELHTRLCELPDNSSFVIGETGFGTGLNFLCARRLFLDCAPPNARLHFISCEKYPLQTDDLKRAHSLFEKTPELSAGCEQLQQLWPPAVVGFHRLDLDDGRVQLTLLYGDAADMFSQLNARVDCWFLDGFAPSKNPDMWRDDLFTQLGRLSHAQTTLATFTAAGVVKRGLTAQGFTIEKIPGYGRKREMLRAQFTGSATAERLQPWLKRPPAITGKSQRIAVVGAGLSGCSTANALARRGYQVDLYEQHEDLATEGSGNPQGALYAKLPAKPTHQSRLHLAGLLYSVELLRSNRLNNGQVADLCGLLQLALDPKEVARFEEFVAEASYPDDLVRWVSKAEASELAGTVCAGPALYFPDAGWVAPRELSRWYVDHPNIQLLPLRRVEHLKRLSEGWSLSQQPLTYDAVVICTAWRSELIEDWSQLGLKAIRGQTTWATQPENARLEKVVCGKGYVSPATQQLYCFGSSFVIGDQTTDLRDNEHQHNLSILAQSLPELAQQLQNRPVEGKAAQRAGSRDYIPIVGGLCDRKEVQALYRALSTDARTEFEGEAPWINGLYVNLGHGSKGLITCPLSAEILAAQICNEPYPVEQVLVDLLSPQRFTIREMIRRGG
ncbi:MAG TPA: bifunctional tRNA (5-methylaminomethyl-2-thiouridine)(34)-methyltransferase MnmD/FAD-dependent 5-carboxymethylaminomethyl-2-thiouridine(34) oxidoreductase MnmC [Marinobacterium sp.]|nr:bifunctional tRNA (5-methylaminomethyl-2-thiouridine)(34)-methyltransferase MnmD/FAD-dependent 5-carboxymethylaminomethyl-2-thiouridine(34) oxidoreductase MnmC [Marinobacterium sp.]